MSVQMLSTGLSETTSPVGKQKNERKKSPLRLQRAVPKPRGLSSPRIRQPTVDTMGYSTSGVLTLCRIAGECSIDGNAIAQGPYASLCDVVRSTESIVIDSELLAVCTVGNGQPNYFSAVQRMACLASS